MDIDLPRLRDILYFDFEKASSIWSQLQWGRSKEISVTTEANTEQQIEAGAGIPKIIEAKFNVGEGEKRTTLETRILHHDLLSRIENMLSSASLVININEVLPPEEASAEIIRNAIGGAPYVVASGWSFIEDHQRILSISEKFNDLTKFISRSALEGVKKSPEYLELADQIEELKNIAKSNTDRNKKSQELAKIKGLEKNLESLLTPAVTGVDQWILDGIKLWITTFVPTRINFRVYPFPKCPSFQIICNLKRDSFVDQDLEHLLYGYTAHPNIPLAIFGLITSIPPESGEAFDPLSEFSEESKLTNEMSFEKAYRGMFGAMDGLENFFRYSRYPNITVHPIAVFRPFTNITEKKAA